MVMAKHAATTPGAREPADRLAVRDSAPTLKATPSTESEKANRQDHALGEITAHYGVLKKDHPVHKFVAARLHLLIDEVPVTDRPNVYVLGRSGYGVNAGATKDGHIFVTPELLTFVKSVEELDFILLHEFIHLAHNHHAAQEKLGDTVLSSLGIQRVHEYDADLNAFILLAQPKRGSSPLGALTCLERFRDKDPKGWDLAHGNLSDRIMNLKMFSLFRDLSGEGALSGDFGSLTKKLRSMPSFIAREVAELPHGSRVATILRHPPDGHRYDTYRKELIEAILDSGTPSLRRAIPSIISHLEEYGDSDGAVHRARTSAYKEALQHAYGRLFATVAACATEHNLSVLEGQVLLGVELTLLDETPERIETNLTGRARSTALAALASLATFSASAEAIERMSHILALVEDGAPFSCTERLFYDVVRPALGENCAFDRDSDETVDIKLYFSSVQKLTKALSALSHRHDRSAERVQNEFDGMAVFTLAAHLADIRSDQLSGLNSEIASLHPSLKSDKRALSQALSSVMQQEHTSETTAAVTQFAKEELEVLSIAETQAALIEIFTQVERFILEDRSPNSLDRIEALFKRAFRVSLNLPTSISCDDVVGDESKNLTSSYTPYSISVHLMEVALARAFPDLPTEGRRDHIAHLNFQESARLKKLEVGFLHTLCSSHGERQDAIDRTEYIVQVHSQSFEEIAALVDEIHSEAPEAFIREESLAPRSFKPEPDIALHEYAGNALLSELKNSQSLSEKGKLERIYKFITVCHVCETEEQRDAGVFREILAIGEASLRAVYQDDRNSPEFIRHAIAVSFFVSDGVLSRSIQRELLLRLIDTAGSATTAEEIFSKLKRQQGHLNLETIEKLDEGASQASDIRSIGRRCREHLLANDAAASQAGRLVLGDMIATGTKRFDFHELLSVGLETSEHDSRLRDEIAKRWWDSASDVVTRDLQWNDLPEPNEIPERLDDAKAWMSTLNATTPRNLAKEFRPAELGSLDPAHFTANAIRQNMYSLGIAERLVVLRKLTSDPTKGILISPERREKVAQTLLGKMVSNAGDDPLSELSSMAFRALFRSVHGDDLALAVTPMLLDRFLRAPSSPSTWRQCAAERASTFLADCRWGKASSQSSRRTISALHSRLLNCVTNHFEWALSGSNPRTQRSSIPALEGLIELCAIEVSPKASVSRTDAISFILDFSRNLQTPGTRALQLLGGIVELPKEIEREFLQVYDAQKGQSKSSALATIDRALPEFASRVASLHRIGGGALYSVFLAELSSGGKEVVRVVNPNPEYHTQRIVQSMKAAQKQLAREDSRFEIGEQVINLVDEWITAELQDQTYEADDKAFRARWNHWTPSRKCPLSIYVPENYPSGTLLVRREEFIPGKNFTELSSLAEADGRLAKQVVALAAQHYVEQLTGSAMENIWGSELLVHSDISPGNLRIMDGGKVAILDRSMFLKFSVKDRKLLKAVMDAKTPHQRASAVVSGLAELQDDEVPKSEVRAIIERVNASLQGESSLEGTMLKGLIAAQREGLKVPLRFQLLVKNLNSLRVMAEKVGFSSLAEALDFKWS